MSSPGLGQAHRAMFWNFEALFRKLPPANTPTDSLNTAGSMRTAHHETNVCFSVTSQQWKAEEMHIFTAMTLNRGFISDVAD